jgi:hypothetical protein
MSHPGTEGGPGMTGSLLRSHQSLKILNYAITYYFHRRDLAVNA